MRLLDYLYYRLFLANVRYRGSQETSRTVFGLSVWLWLLHLPLLVLSKIFCKADLRVLFILYFLYGIFILIFITIRYLNRGWYLKDTFSNCRADKLISDGLFSLILIIGLILIIPATFCSNYMINRYNLSGVGYDFFVNLFR